MPVGERRDVLLRMTREIEELLRLLATPSRSGPAV
jgi:hypothetical protein